MDKQRLVKTYFRYMLLGGMMALVMIGYNGYSQSMASLELMILNLDYVNFTAELDKGNVESLTIDSVGNITGQLRQSIDSKLQFKSYIDPQIKYTILEKANAGPAKPKEINFKKPEDISWLQ